MACRLIPVTEHSLFDTAQASFLIVLQVSGFLIRIIVIQNAFIAII